jgi:hypothetical protein
MLALSFSLSLYKVCQAFDLIQVELTILQCAARKLTGASLPQSRLFRQGREYRGQDGHATMDLELDRFLPGKASALTKDQYDCLIDYVTLPRYIAQDSLT